MTITLPERARPRDRERRFRSTIMGLEWPRDVDCTAWIQPDGEHQGDVIVQIDDWKHDTHTRRAYTSMELNECSSTVEAYAVMIGDTLWKNLENFTHDKLRERRGTP